MRACVRRFCRASESLFALNKEYRFRETIERWNSMLSVAGRDMEAPAAAIVAYSRTDQLEEAMDVYRRYKQTHVSCFAPALLAASENGHMDQCLGILQEAAVHHQVSPAIMARCFDIFFAGLKHHRTSSFFQMDAAEQMMDLVQNGAPIERTHVTRGLLEALASPSLADLVFQDAIVQRCVTEDMQHVYLGNRIDASPLQDAFNVVAATEMTSSEPVLHLLLTKCAKVGDAFNAYMLMQDMHRRGLSVTTETLNVVLQAFYKDRSGSEFIVDTVFPAMNLHPDERTWQVMLQMYASCAPCDETRSRIQNVWEAMTRGSTSTLPLYRTLLYTHSKRHELDACITVYTSIADQGMQHDSSILRSMFAVYCHHNLLEEAEHMYKTLSPSKRNAAVQSSMLGLYVRHARVDETLTLFAQLTCPSAYVTNLVLHLCVVKQQLPDKALEVLTYASDHRHLLRYATVSQFVRLCHKHHMYSGIAHLLQHASRVLDRSAQRKLGTKLIREIKDAFPPGLAKQAARFSHDARFISI